MALGVAIEQRYRLILLTKMVRIREIPRSTEKSSAGLGGCSWQ